MYKLAYEHLIGASVTITKELIEECKNDDKLCMVAFGQEEDRDLNYILGKTITITRDIDYCCLFDDEYENDYLEIEIDGRKYNIPARFFENQKLIPKEPIFEINCIQADGETPGGCPVCPTCKEPTYNLDVCHFCGQHLKYD